jgi:hypothetical protein
LRVKRLKAKYDNVKISNVCNKEYCREKDIVLLYGSLFDAIIIEMKAGDLRTRLRISTELEMALMSGL